MIANWSRVNFFNSCREKEFNWDERRLVPYRVNQNLWKGSGFHEGAASYFALRDMAASQAITEQFMRKQLEGQVVLEEELPAIEHAIAWTRLAVGKFIEHYEGQPVQVLWPEVTFQVPLPNSWHHCFFVHRLMYPDIPFHPASKSNYCMGSCGDPGKPWTLTSEPPACWQPHYFRGKTDAVVAWNESVWLFEHKTNSQVQEQFFKKWFLNGQPTGYLYGIWKSLGVQPVGFILNVIQKPYKNARDQMQVGFAREPYLRSTEDLLSFEQEFTAQCTEYEEAFAARILGTNPFKIYRNTDACTSYGSQCTYFDMCQRHPREPLEGEFSTRDNDYVNDAYTDLIMKWKEQHAA